MVSMSDENFGQLDAKFPRLDGAFIVNTPKHWYAFISSEHPHRGTRCWWNVDSILKDPTCVGEDEGSDGDMKAELMRLFRLQTLRNQWRDCHKEYKARTRGLSSADKQPHIRWFVREKLRPFRDVVQGNSWTGEAISRIFRVSTKYNEKKVWDPELKL